MEATSPASGVSVAIPYNGGNGGVYSGLSIPSVGILNLNAELASGTLNNGNGTLIFNITGTLLLLQLVQRPLILIWGMRPMVSVFQ
ncbi:hypothetical protein OWR28_14375 [Chryseobacterium sp. 1B4]